MKPIAAPSPRSRHLRLVRDGERAPDGFGVSPREMAAGHQVSLPSLPVGESYSHECRSRRQRLTAATRWIRIVRLALKWGRARPLEWLVSGQSKRHPERTYTRHKVSLEQYVSKPRSIRVALTADEREEMQRDLADLARQGIDTTPPANFAECMDDDGPCPWVSCAAHLAYEVDKDGTIKRNFPGVEVWDMADTCSIKVALAHPDGMTLEEAGAMVNLTQERTRQVEAPALAHARSAMTKRKAEREHDDGMIRSWVRGRDGQKR